ncbi:hypothetical protein ADK18_12490 [Bacillus anthracis]|nr:hypothetical protein ADK18_12490 [Bacillus anthracis]
MYCTYQFSLKYFAGDIKYKRFIQAANHEDLPGLYPSLGRKKEISYPDVFLINSNKRYYHVHVYDDRGSEVIANNKKTIRNIYQKYKEWIPEYKRKKIDKVFK